MGFLGGGFFGSGAKSTQTTTNVTTNNQQLAGGDVTGVATGFQNSSGNIVEVNQTLSDSGALTVAHDISQSALDLGAAAIASNTAVVGGGLQLANNVTEYGLDNAQRQLQTSLGFTSDVVRGSNEFGKAALESNNAALSSALGFGQDAFANVSQLAEDFGSYTRSLAETAVSGNAQLASQVSQSSGQTVADSLTKLGLYAALALIAIYAFRSKSV